MAGLNRDAWLEQIMDEYGESLTKLAYNYVKDWKLAEDVVQDVFLICYKQYENKDAILTFKAWIYRMTINKCKDILKSSSFRKVIIYSNLLDRFTSKDKQPDTILMKRSEEEFLSICVLSLPVKYREVIILHYYDELSIEQMSEILKLNKNTIKTRLSRAREKLKKRMERSDDNGK